MQDKIQDKRKRLYDALIASDYDAGADFNDFNNLMDTDEVARRWVYDTAKSEGWKVGDNFEQFVGYITPAQKSPTPQVSNEPYEFGKPVYSQAPNHVEGDIYKHGDSYTRTEIPYRTVEYPTLGEAQEAEKAKQREDALAAYRSAYNRLEAPGEVDEKTLIEWGNNMENAPIEQKNLYTRIMGQDATNRIDLDAVMRSYDETKKSLGGVEDPEGLAAYLMMSAEQKAKLSEGERNRYEGLIKDKRKTDAVDDVNELHERISSLMEQQRVSDIKMRHDYLENRSTGQAIKDAILGIPVAEAPQLQGAIPSSGLDLTPEGKFSNEQNAALTAAGRRWNEMKYLINAAQNGNLFDGLDKALGSIDTWTSDQMLRDNMAIMRVANKFDEEGEKSLTDNERALLDALALNVAVSEMYGDEISNWYKGGEMLGEMAPFMLEMLMNPLSGLGKKAADKVTRKAIEKYGKDIVKKNAKKFALTRGAAKLGASVAGATGMALTTGLPAVGADIQKRMLGDATYGYDNEGNIEYTGHVGGEDLGTSAYKAVTSRMLDNVSEMLGAEYASLPLKWLQKAGKGTKLLGWIDNLANSKFGKGVSRFAEKTKWNGPIEEFLEEVHVGLINPVLVGDQSWEEFFTKDNLATIAIGVAVPGAAISTANTIAGAADGAFKVGAQERWKMQNAEAMGYQLWQDNPNEWNDLTRSLMEGQMEDVEKTLKEVYNNPQLTPEQKKVALEYAVYSLQLRTAQGVKEAFNEGKKFIDPMLRDIYGTAYAEEVSPVQANNAYKAMAEAEKKAQRELGIGEKSVDEWLGGRTAEEAVQDEVKRNAIKAYQAAKLDFEGRRDRYIAEKERAYMESDRSIQANDNNGMVYATQLKDEPVYITGGNVVLNEDGTIDVDNSSEVLYVKFPDGHVEMTSPDKFTEVFTSDRTADLKAAKRAEIDAKWKAEFDTAEAQSVEQEKREAGVVFDKADAQGNHRIEILNEGEDMSNILFDGVETEISTDELNQWKQEAGIQSTENGVQSADAVADDTTDNGALTESEANVAPTGDNVAPVENNEPAPVELPNVPDFFRLGGRNYEVASRNNDGSVDVMVDGKRETLPAGTDYSTHMPTDKKGEVLYEKMPVERTHEYFVQKVKDDEARAEMIEKRRKKAEAERKKFDKKPDPGIDPDAYEAKMTQWEADKKAAQAKVDYWNEVAKRDAEITRSETRDAVENIKPDVMEETADEFIANQLAGIKITPESFKRETGLSNAEQAQLVGVISNDGVSVERAAEIILENYDSELAGMGFTGDVQDVRDIIISVLSQGNPRSYAKKGREAREAENMDQQRADAEVWAKGAFDMTLDELYLYEETILPRMIRDYEGFDENEYYSNLAENNGYDTTRESESIGRGGELLQGEQPVPAGGTPVTGQRNEGGAVSDDVQGGGQNGVAQEEVPVNEPVGNSEQLSSSDIPNNQSVAEGDAPGNGGVYADNQGNPVDADGKLIVDEVNSIDEITDEDFETPARNVQLPAIPENVANAIGTNGRPVVIKKNVFEKNGNTHVELEPEDSRNILRSALYNPNLVGSTQPIRRPDYKVAIRTGEQNAVVVLDVYQEKDFVEIVGWRMVNEKGLAKMQRQAEREGGQFLILSPNDGSAAALSALPLGLSSASEYRNSVSNSQENTQKSGEIAENGGENAKTPMQKLADRILDRTEEKRRIPLRERARELEAQVGVKANIIESVDEVADPEARRRIVAGQNVAGWYSKGEVYLYMPNLQDRREIELTYVHEVVAHHGVKKLLGERFNEFLDGVWNMMSEADRARMLAYVGANENPTLQDMRAAADEYVAELAEKMNLGELEQSTWEKIVDWFKELLESVGFENLTKEDIESMLKASYANLRSTEQGAESKENDFRARMTFHGSGAQFDRFDHAFMGTGEGAQAFGWGTYVTEVEGIGRIYAEGTSGNIFKSGFGDFYLKKIREGLAEGKSFEEIKQDLLEFHAHLYEQVDGNTEMYGEFISDYEKLQSLKEEDLPKRNLYSVEIPDDNGSNYLHWEDVVPDEVIDNLWDKLRNTYGEDVALNVSPKYGQDGEHLYKKLSRGIGGDKQASLFLSDMGFVGISYPAEATTGGRADGARNYVIFNENDAVIKDRTMFRKKDSERRQEKRRINDAIDTAAGFITVGGKKQATKNRLKKEAERKQLTKEMYSSVLKGDFNDVTLSQIDKFIEDATPANPFGRRISQRLPQRMERALRTHERTNAVDALFSRICESTVPANERFSEAGRREIEERKKELLKGWAIATGNWHTDLKEFTDDTEPIGEGKDSKVYMSKDGNSVIKASKGKPFGKKFRPDIDNIPLFNDVFKNSRYEILGYGEIDGQFVRILKQDFIDFAESTPLTPEERKEYMGKLGFKPLNKDYTAFSNGEIVIADLQKSNIVRDVEGDIRVIDADAKLHTKDVGGDYTYPPVEDDLPEDSGTRFRIANENQEIFVSNAQRAVEGIQQNKATAEQWIAMLKKNGGLKAGEDAWLGLEEWLNEKQGAVTKQEILDYIAQNRIQIEEVRYSENARFKGQSYYADRYNAGEADDVMPANDTRLNYTTDGLDNKREIALVVPTVESWNASDEIHFGDAGNGRAVAWVRFGETTDSEGNRVLVIDEIQSKRHQEGREKGYRGVGLAKEVLAAEEEVRKTNRELTAYREPLKEKYNFKELGGSMSERLKNFDAMLSEEERITMDALGKARNKAEKRLQELREQERGIPSAPFEKNWHELAMKRMLRLAAEEGFDKVAWTTGEQQAQRYDMSKVVSHIACDKVGKNGNKSFSMGLDYKFIVDPNGIVVSSKDEYVGKSLADIVGKPLANKMLEMQEGDTISGDGLRIGGEGMKGFYDKMLPSFVQKYTKKWGAKVGEVTMPSLKENNTMWSVDVTPEMQEGVMRGQTMFRKVGNTENNSIFASTYKTEDGKDINYTSERTEGYGVQDDGIGNSNSGSRRSILQRQTDTGVPGADSGLDAEKGEFCVVERMFTENGAFNFTSGEKIESADDVAYIFSALEDAAKEHSFVVYVKDGMPTVVELGMGSFNATMVDVPTASLAYSRINPDHVYFVHNHPSGNLICSSQDVAMLRVFEDMSDVPVTGVIINLKTGKYGTFDTERHSVIGEKRVPEKEERLAVHTLDKQIFAPDYDPMAQPLVRGSQDVAQFLNSQRMGDRPKVSFLILSRANRIIGNIHTPFTNITTDVKAVARYINERVIQFGGENAILYGDFAITSVEGMDFRLLQNAMDRFGKTKLLDVVRVEGNFTRSADDMGLLYEPEAEYKDGQTMFRIADDVITTVDDFNSTHKGAAPTVIIDSIDTLEEQLRAEGFMDEDIEEAKKDFYKELAYYHPTYDKIVINRHDIPKDELIGYLWHENAHRAVDKLYTPEDMERVFNAVYGARAQEIRRVLEEAGYNPEEHAEESIVRGIEDIYLDETTRGKLEKGDWKAKKDATEEQRNVVEFTNQIIDFINNGREGGERGTSGILGDFDESVGTSSAGDERGQDEMRNYEDKGETPQATGESGETRFRTVEETTEGSIDDVQTQPLTLMERITNSLLEVSAKNKENLELRASALRTFGRDINRVLSLMKAQREYDKSTVDTLVKLAKMYFQNAQLLGEVTPYEVARIMGVLNRSVGKRDISTEAAKLMDILLDAHTNALAGILDKAEKIKAKKVNAAGVEVMGRLDKYGQKRVDEYRAAKEMTPEKLEEAIYDSDNRLAELEQRVREALSLTEGDDVDQAARKYTGDNDVVNVYMDERARLEGLTLAREYKESIQQVQEEIKDLKRELKQAEEDYRLGNIDGKSLKEFRKSVAEAIMESKAELIEGYHGLIYKFQENTKESSQRAKAFVQAQIDSAREIQNNANSDLLGHPAEAQGETPDKWNSSVPRLFMSAMPTFQTMLKFFGEKAADGRGYLYERFIPQYTQASHNEYVGKTDAREKMRKKLTEIFGEKTSIEKFMDMSRKDGAVLEYQEGGEKKTIDLTRGQVLYLYMINKMADGQMKLSRMGITDADVLKMAKELPEEMVRFADWVQEEFLTELREKYNKVHERMFGAPMAAIESYFPIKINKRSRGEKIEPGMNAEDKPSTVTGSVIKRTKNAVAIDLSADAMQVLLGHIDDMENWAAFAEFRRDVKLLLNYRHFQNQVKGMVSLRYGSGEELWKNFVDVANIAAGSFKPSSKTPDRFVRNIAKGVVSSKIAFRYFTAVKQILSTPAFWSEVDFGKMMNAYLHQKEAWDWAMKNLPGFSKRWEGRASGNEILLESDADWKVWQNRAVQWLSKEGMRANAFIDALTVATGAKAVFETKYEMFKKAGYSEERAREKALNRAAEAYNESQQSSESAYLSPLQAEATFVSSVLTAYRNSPFGYNRKMATAIANLKKKMKKGFKQESIEYMTKQLMRDGLNEEQAKKFAKSTYRRSVARDAADVALYGFFLNYVWVLGPSLIYILLGDDDEKKKELHTEALIDGAMGGLGNLPAGETLTGAIKAIAEGDVSNFKLPQAVAMQDIETIADMIPIDPVRAAGEVLNILVAMNVGVNPQTFTDMFVALADTEDWGDPRELAMLVLRLINAPNSKLELLEADEAMENYGANIEEITREFAEYQKSKRAPLSGWLYSDDGERKAIERYEKRFKKILDERFEVVVENTDEYDMWYENSDPQMKAKLAKLRQKFLEGDKETTMEKLDSIDVTKKILYGADYNEVNTVYYELSTAEDEDMAMMIDTKLKELQPMMDESKAYREENLEQIQFYDKLNDYKNDVNNLKGAMKKKPERAQEHMNKIRELRAKAMELINNYRNNE